MPDSLSHRFFIKLAYNGANYHGWQQQENATSIQESLTGAIATITGESISLVGCGRTDTGVHAREFYAHFEMEQLKTAQELENLAFRLNRFLPNDIVIFWIRSVPKGLHARFSATRRTYHYYIHTTRDPFLTGGSWFVHDALDVDAMNVGAEVLKRYEDFTSFSKLHSGAKTNICHVMAAEWTREGHRLVFAITADRFLRNMVRAVVGTLVELGQGKISIDELKRIIEAKDRSDAGQSVPAHGLFLERVVYPSEYDEFLGD